MVFSAYGIGNQTRDSLVKDIAMSAFKNRLLGVHGGLATDGNQETIQPILDIISHNLCQYDQDALVTSIYLPQPIHFLKALIGKQLVIFGFAHKDQAHSLLMDKFFFEREEEVFGIWDPSGNTTI